MYLRELIHALQAKAYGAAPFSGKKGQTKPFFVLRIHLQGRNRI